MSTAETRREMVQEEHFASLIGKVMIHDYVQTERLSG